MSHPLLERHLAKGALKPVYLLYGEEEFLLRRAVARIEGWLREHGELAGKVSSEAAEVPLAEVLSAARSPQLWGGRQLVILWGVEHYKGKDLAPLAAYLAAPSTWTCLVLVGWGMKAKDLQTAGPWKGLLEQDAVLAFPRLREGEVLKWLEQEAKRHGKGWEPGAARLLLETAGANLAELAQQLEKLILYTGTEGQISTAAVRRLASQSRVHTIFELVESLGQSRPDKALTVLHRLLALGEHPSVILVMLARQLRLLLRTKEALARHLNANQLAKELGVLPFVAERLQRQAVDLPAAQLQAQLLALQEADQQIKSGTALPNLQLEKVILELSLGSGPMSGHSGH